MVYSAVSRMSNVTGPRIESYTVLIPVLLSPQTSTRQDRYTGEGRLKSGLELVKVRETTSWYPIVLGTFGRHIGRTSVGRPQPQTRSVPRPSSTPTHPTVFTGPICVRDLRS